jgi:hypothetical protein
LNYWGRRAQSFLDFGDVDVVEEVHLLVSAGGEDVKVDVGEVEEAQTTTFRCTLSIVNGALMLWLSKSEYE